MEKHILYLLHIEINLHKTNFYEFWRLHQNIDRASDERDLYVKITHF